jgi:hypothetical protein
MASRTGSSAPRVSWDHEPVNVTADQALAMTTDAVSRGTGDSDALGDAMRWIQEEFLTKQEIEAAEIIAWARNAGISAETLKRARKKLGVVTRREGFGPGAKYYLSIPRSGAMEGQD